MALNQNWVTGALAVAAVLGVGLVGTIITMLDRKEVIASASVIYQTDQPVYHPRETVTGTVAALAHRSCPGTHFKWLDVITDDGRHWSALLPSTEAKLEERFGEIEYPARVNFPMIPFQVPDDAPEGEASMWVIAQYTCSLPGHWIWPIETEYPPARFRIERDDKP
jgi:hypothetical protein